MYGTMARIRVKTGHEDDLMKVNERWSTERKAKVPGVVAGYLYKLDSDSRNHIMVAVFQDKASYRANADDPEQDKWFRELRQHLESDPEWNDGEISKM